MFRLHVASGSPLRFGIRKFDMLRKITFRHLFRGQRDTQARVSLQDATTALQNDARTSPTPSPRSQCGSGGIEVYVAWHLEATACDRWHGETAAQAAGGFRASYFLYI